MKIAAMCHGLYHDVENKSQYNDSKYITTTRKNLKITSQFLLKFDWASKFFSCGTAIMDTAKKIEIHTLEISSNATAFQSNNSRIRKMW